MQLKPNQLPCKLSVARADQDITVMVVSVLPRLDVLGIKLWSASGSSRSVKVFEYAFYCFSSVQCGVVFTAGVL